MGHDQSSANKEKPTRGQTRPYRCVRIRPNERTVRRSRGRQLPHRQSIQVCKDYHDSTTRPWPVVATMAQGLQKTRRQVPNMNSVALQKDEEMVEFRWTDGERIVMVKQFNLLKGVGSTIGPSTLSVEIARECWQDYMSRGFQVIASRQECE